MPVRPLGTHRRWLPDASSSRSRGPASGRRCRLLSGRGTVLSMNDSEALKHAIAAHGRWKSRLRQAIDSGQSEWTAAAVRPDTLCEFGKWLHARAPAEKLTEHWKKIRSLHSEFHEEAARILALALANRKAEARGGARLRQSLRHEVGGIDVGSGSLEGFQPRSLAIRQGVTQPEFLALTKRWSTSPTCPAGGPEEVSPAGGDHHFLGPGNLEAESGSKLEPGPKPSASGADISSATGGRSPVALFRFLPISDPGLAASFSASAARETCSWPCSCGRRLSALHRRPCRRRCRP